MGTSESRAPRGVESGYGCRLLPRAKIKGLAPLPSAMSGAKRRYMKQIIPKGERHPATISEEGRQ